MKKVLKVIAGFFALLIVVLAIFLIFPFGKPEIVATKNYESLGLVIEEDISFEGKNSTRIIANLSLNDFQETLKFMLGFGGGNPKQIALLKDAEFNEGTIDVDIYATLTENAVAGARGFVGIAFRVDPNLTGASVPYDAIYLRPDNGRTDDPERKKHAIQYISHPHFHFDVSREEAPGKYEKPADIGLGEWIHLTIEVEGNSAKAYVNGELVLEVDELHSSSENGTAIALWANPGTDAHFANLEVVSK